MKINKVLFSCSEPEEYSSFWNTQSKIFASMGIDPVCLLFGERAKTNMTEEHGQVIEVPLLPDLPWMAQLAWSKFDYPTREPETTWLIGDMDLVPLQRAHFTSKIQDVDPAAFLHLNAGGISQPRIGALDGFLTQGPERVRKDQGKHGGADLPAHYHVARGELFKIFTQDRSFADQVRHLTGGRYGLGPMGNKPPAEAASNPYWHFWCAEENYTSELLWNAIHDHGLKFVPHYYNNNHNGERLNRDAWDNSTYRAADSRVRAKKIVDIHCCRPYKRQAADLERLIELSGVMRDEPAPVEVTPMARAGSVTVSTHAVPTPVQATAPRPTPTIKTRNPLRNVIRRTIKIRGRGR